MDKVALSFFGFLVLFVVAVIFLAYFFDIGTCNTLTELNPDYNFQYRFFGGCLMETGNGFWLPVENIKYLIGQE